ncbi:MAG TPA: branched-chain amino acid ABC transporter permease, partial [Bacillota bacterium]|nr:branched-chain amino acid ABC transporter permease [Bacillota bacterium]
MIIGQIIANGILMGFIYALVAVGLTLTWGVMDIINFAHGEFLMIGMYTAFWMFSIFAIDPLAALPICIAVLFTLGVLTYTGIIKRVINAPGLTALLATFGFSMFLKNFAQFLWTPNFRYINESAVSGKTLELGNIVIGVPQVAAAAASIILTIAVMAFIDKTRTGKAIQATALNKNTALLMGINTKKMYAIT